MSKLVCEQCGATEKEKTGWIPNCPIHFGYICSSCCWNCRYMEKDKSSLTHCLFKENIKA